MAGGFKFYRPPYDDAGTAPAPVPEKTAADYVKEWQTWLGTEPDGDPGSNTLTCAIARLLAALLAAHALRKNDKGDAVYIVQGLLYAQGYDPDGLDGSYGNGTAAAVRKFQGDHGLEVDGVAGKGTVAALLAALQK